MRYRKLSHKTAGIAVYLCLAISLVIPLDADSQNINPAEVITWQAVGAQMEGNERLRLFLRLLTSDGFSLYRDKITFSLPFGMTLVEKREPPTVEVIDPLTGDRVETFGGGEFELLLQGRPSATSISLAITYIGCTDKICLFPYTETLRFEVASATVDSTSAGIEQRLVDYTGQSKRSFWWLVVIALIGGLLTNLTPCILPMIPITVKTLGRQHLYPQLSALLYGAGIIFSYTALGLVVSATGGLFGALLGNLWFALLFSALMFVFGLSMLGWGNLAFLQRLGTSFGGQKKSLLNTWLLGLGAGLVAAPCTGPILGALLAYAATQLSGLEATSLFFAYSFAFASPYMFAGGLVAKLARIKVASRLQVATKLVLAGLMFGLFFYYLRIPLYRQLQGLADYWFMLSFIFVIAGGLAIGLCLWQLRFARHRLLTLVFTFIFGFGLFAFAQGVTTPSRPTVVEWLTSEQQAMAQAELTGAPILLDAWAEWCERCKQMDAYTYTDRRLARYLEENTWLTLKLDFTRTTPETTALRQKYGILSLPTTILIPASGDLSKKVTISGFLDAPTLIKHLHKFSTTNN